MDDFPLDANTWIAGEVSIAQGPDWALSMTDAPSKNSSRGRLWICHLRLPESIWIVRTYRIAWERSKISLRMEIFRGLHFQNGLDEWKAYDVEVSDFLVHVNFYHDHS